MLPDSSFDRNIMHMVKSNNVQTEIKKKTSKSISIPRTQRREPGWKEKKESLTAL